MTEHQPTAAAYIVEQIHLTIDRLREAWEWLEALVEPGRPQPSPGRAMTDDQSERLEAIGHSDRAYRTWNLRQGMSALPPSPAAARLGIVDVQMATHETLVAVVCTLADTGNETTRRWADTIVATVPGMLDWLDGYAFGLGPTGFDGLLLRPGAVDRIRDANLAAAVDKELQRVDRIIRAAADATDDEVVPIHEPCPACCRRSLQREVSSSGVGRVVRCISKSCRCTGDAEPDRAACKCGRTQKRPGRPHVWLPSELDELAAAVEAGQSPRPRLGRGGAGHGGWQSRNMALGGGDR